MTVQDQVDRAALPVHQTLEKTDQHLRAYAALDYYEAQCPFWADRRNHVQGEALPGHPVRNRSVWVAESGSICRFPPSQSGEAMRLWRCSSFRAIEVTRITRSW